MSGLDNDGVRVKLEIDESAGHLDVAREKFENALQDLLYKDEVSDSEAEDTAGTLASDLPDNNENGSTTENTSITPSSRPPRKRRRKDADSSQSGKITVTSQQSRYIVRIFDRCIDLSQFSAQSPLYPICRAWLLNNESNPGKVGEMSMASLLPPSPDKSKSDLKDVHFLPTPVPWSAQEERNPIIPAPIAAPPLDVSGGTSSPQELLSHHLSHWKDVRQTWRRAAAAADVRYQESAAVLKEIFHKNQNNPSANNSNSESP